MKWFFYWTTHWKEERCKKLPSSYSWYCNRPQQQTWNLLKKLTQKALTKVNFKMETLILSYLVMWFAVNGQKRYKTIKHIMDRERKKLGMFDLSEFQ